MCELFISLILTIFIFAGAAATIWYLLASRKDMSYKPIVTYDHTTGKVKLVKPTRKY